MLFSCYVCVSADGSDATYVPGFQSQTLDPQHVLSPTNIHASTTSWTVPTSTERCWPSAVHASYPNPIARTSILPPKPATYVTIYLPPLIKPIHFCYSPSSRPISDDDASSWWTWWPTTWLRWRTCTACAHGRCWPPMM